MIEFNVFKHNISLLGIACFKFEILVIENLVFLVFLLSFNSNKIVENLCNSIFANIESRFEIKFFKFNEQSPFLASSKHNETERSG